MPDQSKDPRATRREAYSTSPLLDPSHMKTKKLNPNHAHSISQVIEEARKEVEGIDLYRVEQRLKRTNQSENDLYRPLLSSSLTNRSGENSPCPSTPRSTDSRFSYRDFPRPRKSPSLSNSPLPPITGEV